MLGRGVSSAAITTAMFLAGFGAVTPLIVVAILNPHPPAASVASDARGEITASIAPTPETPVARAAAPSAFKHERAWTVVPTAAKVRRLPAAMTEKSQCCDSTQVTVPEQEPGPQVEARLATLGQEPAEIAREKPPRAPRGVVSMHVKVPQYDAPAWPDAGSTMEAGENPAGEAARKAQEIPVETEPRLEPLRTAVIEPHPDRSEPAASESELEDAAPPAWEPKEPSAAAEEPQPEGDAEIPVTKPRPNRGTPVCQSALKIDPGSASKIDPSLIGRRAFARRRCAEPQA
jgi:hypothetical protein